MAQVNAKITGGDTVVKTASTLGELMDIMQTQNYTARINGELVDDKDYELSDEDFVLFSVKAKGA